MTPMIYRAIYPISQIALLRGNHDDESNKTARSEWKINQPIFFGGEGITDLDRDEENPMPTWPSIALKQADKKNHCSD